MPNRFQIKRTTTSGLLPNVSNSSNTSYIAAGELAINLTDRKLLSSNGSATFEIGANLASISVGGALTGNSTGLFVSSAAPQISLNNATSNWITFSTNGVAAPATTTRSAGTKLALYPSLNATQVDYAIGIESNHMWFSTDNATTGVKFYANTSNYMTANVAGLYHTGDITAFFSDDRLKDRYSNIPNAIEKVKSLNGFYYEPNITAQDLGYQKEMHVGVSAQEVNAIMPEVVAPAPIDNKYMTVKYERLIPLLIEAIKEQQVQIDELKAQLNKD